MILIEFQKYLKKNQWDSKVALVVKYLPANAGDLRDLGSIPGLGRSAGEGHGNPLQCSCLENAMDRGAWHATCPQGHKELHMNEITLLTKVHLVKAKVFPGVMYERESLTIKKAERQRIDAFELWCWRRLLRVPRIARRSNQLS